MDVCTNEITLDIAITDSILFPLQPFSTKTCIPQCVWFQPALICPEMTDHWFSTPSQPWQLQRHHSAVIRTSELLLTKYEIDSFRKARWIWELGKMGGGWENISPPDMSWIEMGNMRPGDKLHPKGLCAHCTQFQYSNIHLGYRFSFHWDTRTYYGHFQFPFLFQQAAVALKQSSANCIIHASYEMITLC